MGKVTFQVPPHPRDHSKITVLTITYGKPRENTDDLSIAGGGERSGSRHETLRFRETPGGKITRLRPPCDIRAKITACIFYE